MQAKETIRIRKAQAKDATAIAQVAARLHLNDNAKKKVISSSGFLVWVQPEHVYRERLLKSDYFFVATCRNQVVGFIMSYPVRDLFQMGSHLTYECNIIDWVRRRSTGDSLFLDQIGILPEFNRLGIGSLLWNHLKKAAVGKTFYAAIFHAPVKNLASISFFQSNGWSGVDEVKQGGATLGMYNSSPLRMERWDSGVEDGAESGIMEMVH